MSVSLTQEEEDEYTQIIDGILKTADLQTVTRKKIRIGLETALGGKDLTQQKGAIKSLIEERFDAISNPAVEAEPEPEPDPEPESDPVPSPTKASPGKRPANGHAHEAEGSPEDEADDQVDEIKVLVQPPKKKQRKSSEDTEDADAKLAAQLQAEENSRRGRATRGGGAKAKPIKKRKKKSSAKVNSDGEEEESPEGEGKKKKAGGGFQKPFNLSPSLAELTGESQVVKKLWEHIKANELQDPKDKRQIRCDDMMYAVFKQAKIDMFQMNKHVGNHLYPVEEE